MRRKEATSETSRLKMILWWQST